MAASVLNSAKAVEMSIQVVRAFVRLRHLLASHHQLAAKLDELERKIATHDTRIVALFDAVRSLMAAPDKPKRQIGFQTKGKGRSPTKVRERGANEIVVDLFDSAVLFGRQGSHGLDLQVGVDLIGMGGPGNHRGHTRRIEHEAQSRQVKRRSGEQGLETFDCLQSHFIRDS